jgi:hypothetical protein
VRGRVLGGLSLPDQETVKLADGREMPRDGAGVESRLAQGEQVTGDVRPIQGGRLSPATREVGQIANEVALVRLKAVLAEAALHHE